MRARGRDGTAMGWLLRVLEALIEQQVRPEAEKAGVSVREVRFGYPMLPPELVVARLREQLAVQLEQTYQRERLTQVQRTEAEKARATAEQQPELVAAEIQVKVAKQRREADRLRGEGRHAELEALAAGQRERVAVLGQDRVMQLEALRKILATAKERPEIVKVPQVLVQDSNGSMEGAAAILGASNLTQMAGTNARQ
jgi:regulator of protease activity HflC (stomatin/prohibitin superfamily)